MTSRDIEAMVRSVIIDRGLPLELVAVTAAPTGWELRLRLEAREVISVIVPDGRPASVRAAVQERLEAAI